jgi:hypothetical protein
MWDLSGLFVATKVALTFLEDRAKRVLPYASEPTKISYVVNRILNHKGEGNLREYLVEWAEKSIMDSWVPKENDLIRDELERNCLGMNAYRFNWNMFNGLLCWVNPPFDEIMNVVDKAIVDDIGKFILITPNTNRRIEYLAGKRTRILLRIQKMCLFRFLNKGIE